MELVISIIAVIFVFGLIVFVHELGHMLAAKASGNAVPNFAIGMGPSLVSATWGETRYHLCLLPIGGFVTVSGLDSEDDPGLPEHKKWQARTGWQKAFILVAGVMMNCLLALVAVLVMGLVGFPKNAVRITEVREGSPGITAGLLAGDVITAINGHRIAGARQFTALVRANRDTPLELTVYRDGAEIPVQATPKIIDGYNNSHPSLGLGLQEDLYSTTEISLVQPKSLGDDLNLRPGDTILSVNGKPAGNGWDVLRALALFDPETLEPVDADGKLLAQHAGEPIKLVIARSAANLGLNFNDQGIAVDANGADLQPQGVLPGQPIRLVANEAGKAQLEYVLPGDTTPISLGVQFKPELLRLPFGQSVVRSLQDGAMMMLGMVYGLKLAFTKEGAKSISGPVGLASMIAQSARSDWYTFLQIILLINLNLAFLNLLPLPALDGGRLVFVALAGIGLRISEKREALVHAVGMVVLLGLIALVTFSDVLALF